MSQRDLVAIAVLAIFAALVVFSINAIRQRMKKQASMGSLLAVEELDGALFAEVAAKYVSTVFTGRPLERIVSNGLMHRGLAQIRFLSDGIQVIRTGEVSFAIAASSIIDVSRASATIDRGVESGGLLAISWRLGSTDVTTNFRLSADDDTEELFEMLAQYKGKGVIQ